MNTLQSTYRTDFDKFYDFGSEIGRGKYAVVKKCYCKQTRKCYAAKIIRRHRAVDSRLKLNIVENEIRALRLVQSHPSIINLYDVFHIKDDIVLMLEYATQRDLHRYLGFFNEIKAAHIIQQVLKAIEFLHSKHIIHLDIKPENVLLMFPTKSKDEPGTIETNTDKVIENEYEIDDFNPDAYEIDEIRVKLCDFSFSQVMTNGKKILGMMGTVPYSAPEVLEFDALTKATDMWSLGVLTHVLLTSYTPFGNGDEENLETQSNILTTRNEPFKCDDEYFENISDEAKLFIEDLLQFRPKQRLTVEQALNHKWFKKFNFYEKNNTQSVNLNNNNNSNINNNNNEIEQFSLIDSNQHEINQITTTITKAIHLHYENNSLQYEKTSTSILSAKLARNINLNDHANENEITKSTLTSTEIYTKSSSVLS